MSLKSLLRIQNDRDGPRSSRKSLEKYWVLSSPQGLDREISFADTCPLDFQLRGGLNEGLITSVLSVA